jgi:hypothetical protein
MNWTELNVLSFVFTYTTIALGTIALADLTIRIYRKYQQKQESK